jgi:hypothetical protein
VDQVRLNNVHGCGWAILREITGVEEQAVASTTTADAIHLLENLLVSSHPGSLKCEALSGLTAWDRDRLLAVVYIRIYGPQIKSTVNCAHCHEAFDLDFSLPRLLESLSPENVVVEVQMIQDGLYEFSDGLQFRLPTGEDEYAVMGLSQKEAVQELLKRCIQNASEYMNILNRTEEVQSAMEAIAPLIDLELDARCPECGQEQQVHFDLQHYLLSALNGERTQLMREIHALASTYGWSLTDILSLPRSQRKSLASLVDADYGLEGGRGL